MNRILRLATLGGLALATTGLIASPAGAVTTHHHRHGDVFVQTDDPSGNSVVAYRRDRDGRLHEAATYATGGDGGVLAGSVVDHLASQGSLQYERRAGLVYVTNAGSDTITVFRVHGTQLRRVQIIGSGGSFPVSIAVHGHAVYVLDARDGGVVQGYLRFGDRLLRIPAWHRALGLDASATPEFTHTPGQVAFTPDGRHLLVTTKANTNAIDVFGVDRFGGISRTPAVTSLPGAVPFAVSFDREGHAVVAEAGPNAVQTFTLRSDGGLVPVDTALTGQAATCWIVLAGRHAYVSNAGSGTVSGYDVSADGTLAAGAVTSTDGGTVDATVSQNGRYLYVQTGLNGIVDEFRIGRDGALTALGSVLVPDAVGAEGIAAS